MAKIVEVGEMERRRDRRRETLLEGRVQGHAIAIVDVSFGGLGAAVDFVGHSDSWAPQIGTETYLELISAAGEVHAFDVKVVRCNPVDGQFGVRFMKLNDHQYRLVERLMMGRDI